MITMLPSPSAVEEVYCGAGGALTAAGGVRPRLLLDCSTIDPPTAQRVAEAAETSTLHPEACAPHSHTALGHHGMQPNFVACQRARRLIRALQSAVAAVAAVRPPGRISVLQYACSMLG